MKKRYEEKQNIKIFICIYYERGRERDRDSG